MHMILGFNKRYTPWVDIVLHGNRQLDLRCENGVVVGNVICILYLKYILIQSHG